VLLMLVDVVVRLLVLAKLATSPITVTVPYVRLVRRVRQKEQVTNLGATIAALCRMLFQMDRFLAPYVMLMPPVAALILRVYVAMVTSLPRKTALYAQNALLELSNYPVTTNHALHAAKANMNSTRHSLPAAEHVMLMPMSVVARAPVLAKLATSPITGTAPSVRSAQSAKPREQVTKTSVLCAILESTQRRRDKLHALLVIPTPPTADLLLPVHARPATSLQAETAQYARIVVLALQKQLAMKLIVSHALVQLVTIRAMQMKRVRQLVLLVMPMPLVAQPSLRALAILDTSHLVLRLERYVLSALLAKRRQRAMKLIVSHVLAQLVTIRAMQMKRVRQLVLLVTSTLLAAWPPPQVLAKMDTTLLAETALCAQYALQALPSTMEIKNHVPFVVALATPIRRAMRSQMEQLLVLLVMLMPLVARPLQRALAKMDTSLLAATGQCARFVL